MAQPYRPFNDPEVQDQLNNLPVAPEAPPIDLARAQTLARSSKNPTAQREGQAMLEQERRRQEQSQQAAQSQAAAAQKQAEAEQRRIQNEQKAARDRDVRAAAAQGQKTTTDVETGDKTIARHPDGAPIWKAGPVKGAPLVPVTQTTVMPGEQPGQSRATPPSNPMIPGDGALGAMGTGTESTSMMQPGRTDRNEPILIEPDTTTDPKTGRKVFSSTDPTTGQTVKQAVGIDQELYDKKRRDEDIKKRRNELMLSKNLLEQDRRAFQPKWDPVEREFKEATAAFEKINSMPFRRVVGPDNVERWQKYKTETNEDAYATPAEIAVWENSRKQAQARLDAAKAKHDKLLPFAENLKRNEARIADEDLMIDEDSIRAASGEPPRDRVSELFGASPDGMATYEQLAEAQLKDLGMAKPTKEQVQSHAKQLQEAQDEKEGTNPFMRQIAGLDIEAARVQHALSTGKVDQVTADKRFQVLAEVKNQTIEQAKAEAKQRLEAQGREIASRFIGTGVQSQELSGTNPGNYAGIKNAINEMGSFIFGGENIPEKTSQILRLANNNLDKAIEMANGDTALNLQKMKDAFDQAGIQPDERKRIIQDAAKSQAWTEKDTDNLRQLSTGDLVINPGRVFGQKDALLTEINSASTTPQAKAAAAKRLDAMREKMAPKLFRATVYADSGFEKFANQQLKAGNQDKAAILDQWAAQQKDRNWVFKATDAVTEGVKTGSVGVVKTIVGTGAGLSALAGADSMAAGMGQFANEAGRLIQSEKEAAKLRGITGGYGIASDMADTVTQMAPMIAGGTLASGLKGLSAVATRGASVYGWAAAQGYESKLSDALDIAASEKGSALTSKEIAEVLGKRETQVAGFLNAAQTAILSAAFPRGAEAGALGKASASMTVSDFLRRGGARAIKDGALRQEIKAIGKNILLDGKDEALEEFTNQVLDGMISAAALDQNLKLGDLLEQSFNAGAMGFGIGGAMPQLYRGRSRSELHQQMLGELQNQAMGQPDAKMVSTAIMALDPQAKAPSASELKQARQLVGPSRQPLKEIDALRADYEAAIQAKDYATAAKIDQQIGERFTAAQTETAQDAADAVLLARELTGLEEQASEALWQADEALTAAKATGDKQAIAQAEANLEQVEKSVPKVSLVRAAVKIATGQDVSALTDAELRAIGYKPTNSGGIEPMNPKELEAEGLTKPLIRAGADGSPVLLDEAVETVVQTSAMAANRIKLGEQEAMQAAQDRATAAAPPQSGGTAAAAPPQSGGTAAAPSQPATTPPNEPYQQGTPGSQAASQNPQPPPADQNAPGGTLPGGLGQQPAPAPPNGTGNAPAAPQAPVAPNMAAMDAAEYATYQAANPSAPDIITVVRDAFDRGQPVSASMVRAAGGSVRGGYTQQGAMWVPNAAQPAQGVESTGSLPIGNLPIEQNPATPPAPKAPPVKETAPIRPTTTQAHKADAKALSDSLKAEIEAEFPNLQGRIGVADNNKLQPTGGVYADFDGSIVLNIPDVAVRVRLLGVDAAKLEMRAAIVAHEARHLAQFEFVENNRENGETFNQAWNRVYGKSGIYGELASIPGMLERLKEIYDGKAVTESGDSSWEQIATDANKAAEGVRILLEIVADPSKAKEQAELFELLRAKGMQDSKMVELIKGVVTKIKEMIASLASKDAELFKPLKEHLEGVEKLYQAMIEAPSSVAGNGQSSPQVAESQATATPEPTALFTTGEAIAAALERFPTIAANRPLKLQLYDLSAELAAVVEGMPAAERRAFLDQAFDDWATNLQELADAKAAEEKAKKNAERYARVKEMRAAAQARVRDAARAILNGGNYETLSAIFDRGRITPKPQVIGLILARKKAGAKLTEKEQGIIRNLSDWDGMPRKIDYPGGGNNAVIRAILDLIYARQGEGQMPNVMADGLVRNVTTASEMFEKVDAELRSLSRGKKDVAGYNPMDDPNYEPTDEEIAAYEAQRAAQEEVPAEPEIEQQPYVTLQDAFTYAIETFGPDDAFTDKLEALTAFADRFSRNDMPDLRAVIADEFARHAEGQAIPEWDATRSGMLDTMAERFRKVLRSHTPESLRNALSGMPIVDEDAALFSSPGPQPSIIRNLDSGAASTQSAADERLRDPAQILQSFASQGDSQGSLRADDRQRRKYGRTRISAASLRSWAEDAGRSLNPKPFVALIGEQNPQGGEHLVVFDPATVRVVKLTKPGFFGAQGEDAQAYLERWALHNRAFSDDVAFEGLVTLPGEDMPRAVISQAFAQGRDATPDEQRDHLIEKGFHEMDDGRWIHPIREIVAWDTITPGNAIMTDEGVRFIDLQMAIAPKEQLNEVRQRTGIGRESLFSSPTPNRTRPKTLIAFDKPYKGPSGSALVAYEWKHKMEEAVDNRGEDVVRRISDWNEATTNWQTGREIVHQFYVDSPSGERRIVSLETAIKLLGYLKSDTKGTAPVKRLGDMVKRRGLLSMEAEALRPIVEESNATYARYEKERDALERERMPAPVFTVENGTPIMRIGALERWGTLAGTPESFAKRSEFDLRSLENEWRIEEAKARAGGRGDYNASRKLADIEARIAKLDRNIQEASAAGADTAQDPAQASTDAPDLFSAIENLPPGPNAKFNENIGKAYEAAKTEQAKEGIANDAAAREGLKRGRVQNMPQAMMDFGMSGSFGTKDQPGLFSSPTATLDRPSTETANILKNAPRGADGHPLAPNGQRSNLTESQWATVRTKNFKRWFGDWERFATMESGVWSDTEQSVSKAVDSNGEPLVLYHGSKEAGFDVFDPEMADSRNRPNTVFFSDSERTAATYSGSRREVIFEKDEYGDPIIRSAIYAVFLNIRNPYEANFEGANWDGTRSGQFMVMDAEGEQLYSDSGRGYFADEEDAQALAEMNDGAEVVPAEDGFETTNSVATDAVDYGNDSAIIRDVIDDGGEGSTYDTSDVYVIFDSNQVKSAVANNGDFSSDPSILFSSPSNQRSFDFGVTGGFNTRNQTGFDFTPAQQVEAAAAETDTNPTEAQIEAGNYRKGKVTLHGMPISIENPRGSTRSGTDKNGKAWSVEMAHHYGYFLGTEGKDKDHVDTFIGPDVDSTAAFVVNQINPATGRFDEHKVMLGFKTRREAIDGYLASYSPGWKGLGDMVETNVTALKAWIDSGKVETPVNARTFDSSLPQPSPSKGITDFGEKLGGARKDQSIKTGQSARPKKTSDKPGWFTRYEVNEVIADSAPASPLESFLARSTGMIDTGEKGRFVINDKRKTDWRGNPERATRRTFATLEEAEAFIPIIEVNRNHRVRKGEDMKYGIWRKVSDRKIVQVVKQTFDTEKEATDYMEANAAEIIETKTSWREELIVKPEKAVRLGPDRRQGPATPEMFQEAFGFRGVEFGNWMRQAGDGKERQEVLNHAYDGLLDLAELLAIPPKAISLNGELGLAFGARGQGLSGAKAHYEPDYVVINLTKMSGAGSLAHEWIHALDHYLGRQDGRASSQLVKNRDGDMVLKPGAFENNAVSSGFSRQSNVREEVRNSFIRLMDTIMTKAVEYVEDSNKAENFVSASRKALEDHLQRLRKEYTRDPDPRWEKRRKPANTAQLALFESIADRLVNGQDLASEWRGIDSNARGGKTYRWTNDTLEQLGALHKQITNRSGFSTERNGWLDDLRGYMERYRQRIAMLESAAASETKVKKVPTDFSMNAKRIDQGSASDYWNTPHEMLARGFSAYVEDRIAASGGTSDFLSYGSDNNLARYRMFNLKPFPEGTEREAINERFDQLFDVIEAEETDKGVRLFSSPSPGSLRADINSAFNLPPASYEYQPSNENRPSILQIARENGVELVSPIDRDGQARRFSERTGTSPIFYRGGEIKVTGFVSKRNPEVIFINAEREDVPVAWTLSHELIHAAQKDPAANPDAIRETIAEHLTEAELLALENLLLSRNYRQDELPTEIPAFLTADAVADYQDIGFDGFERGAELQRALVDHFEALPLLRPQALPQSPDNELARAPQQPDLFAAATAPDAAQKLGQVRVGTMNALGAYRALTAKRNAGKDLTPKEEQQLLDAETALGQKLAFDMEGVRGTAPTVNDSLTVQPTARFGQNSRQVQDEMSRAGEIDRGGQISLLSSPTSNTRPVPNDLPDAVILHGLGATAEHPDYKAAKAGNPRAALSLARDLVTTEAIDSVKALIGDTKPIVVPVLAIEESGRNMIPLATGNMLASRLGLEISTEIIQSVKAFRGGKSALDRLFSQSAFDGPVTSGADYLLVDDTLTQGGTFAALSSHIQANGGRVAGVVALTGKQYSAKLRLSDELLDEIRATFGDVENDFRRATGYGFDRLTESEARAIARFRPADAIRSRIIAEGNEARVRVDEEGTGERLGSSPTPESSAAVQAALAGMKPIYRKVFELVNSGSTAEEVMSRFNLSAKAVENILNDARSRITAAMGAASPAGLNPVMVGNQFADGRPDLAYSTNPTVAAIDQIRNESTVPGVRSDAEVFAEGDRRLAADYDGEFAKLETKANNLEFLSDVEAYMAQRIVARETLEGKTSTATDRTRIAMFIHGYRDIGTETARALRQRYDKGVTPAERHARFIAEALFTPDPETRNRMRKAKKGEMPNILAGWMKRVDSIKAELLAQGIDLDASLAAFNAEQQARKQAEAESPRMKAALEATVRKLSPIEKTVVETIRSGSLVSNVQKLTGLPVSEIKEIWTSFVRDFEENVRESTRRFMAAALASSPTDLMAQLKAEFGIYDWDVLDDTKEGFVDRREEIRNPRKPRRKPEAKPEAPKVPGLTPEQQAALDEAFERFSTAPPSTWTAWWQETARKLTPMIGQTSFEQFRERVMQPWRDRWQTEMDAITNPAGRMTFEEWIAKPSTAEKVKRERDMFAPPVSTTTGERSANPVDQGRLLPTQPDLVSTTTGTFERLHDDSLFIGTQVDAKVVMGDPKADWKAKYTQLSDGTLLRRIEGKNGKVTWEVSGGTFDLHDPIAVKRVMDAFAIARGTKWDALMEYWRMSILTGPQTLIVNTTSNVMNSAYNLVPRRIAEAGVNSMLSIVGLGSDKAATFGELVPMVRELHRGVQLGARLALTSWQMEGRTFEAYANATALQMDFSGVGAEYVPPALGGKFGKLMRSLSFRHMTAADEFLKSVYGQMETAAQAHRIAAREEKLKGKAYDARITELMEPGSVAWVRAFDESKRVTFQQDLAFSGLSAQDAANKAKTEPIIAVVDAMAEAGMRFRNMPFAGPAFSFFLPFIQTPANIFKMGIEMSPLGSFLAVVDGVRSLRRRIFRGDMTKEEATAEAQQLYDKARFVRDLTNQTLAWTVFFALQGLLEGGDDDDELPMITGTMPYKSTKKGERDNAYAVMPPMTIRIGNTQFSYARFDPFKTVLASLADVHKSARQHGGFMKAGVVSDTVVGIKNQIHEMPVLYGLSSLFKVMEDPERGADKLAGNIVTGFVPNLIRQPIREMDGILRDTSPRGEDGFFTSLAKRVGYSVVPQAAPARLDVWGNPIQTNRGDIIGNSVTDAPIRVVDPTNLTINPKADPIDRWIFKWNEQTGDSSQKIAIQPIPSYIEITPPGEKKRRRINLTVEEQAAANQSAGKQARAALGDEWDKAPFEEQYRDIIVETYRNAQRMERERIKNEKLAAGLPPLGN